MRQFRLSTVFALITVIAAVIAVWVSRENVDHSVTLAGQSNPVLELGARSERQSYELSQDGTTYTLVVKFDGKSYPSSIYPRISWSFQFSDGTHGDWTCNGLVVRWEFDSAGNQFMAVDPNFTGNTPYEVLTDSSPPIHVKYWIGGAKSVTPSASYRIVKYWWVSDVSRTSITQQLHFYLIANDSNKILAEHQVQVVVKVIAPDEASEPPTAAGFESVAQPKADAE